MAAPAGAAVLGAFWLALELTLELVFELAL
jgi:hypothetical protein